MRLILTTILTVISLLGNSQTSNAILIEKITDKNREAIHSFFVIKYDSLNYTIEDRNFSFSRNDSHGVLLQNGYAVIKVKNRTSTLQYVINIYDKDIYNKEKILYVFHYTTIDNAYVSYKSSFVKDDAAVMDYIVRFIEVPEGIVLSNN